eukprot:6431993-Heterocapsa_arctica.AAC.1
MCLNCIPTIINIAVVTITSVLVHTKPSYGSILDAAKNAAGERILQNGYPIDIRDPPGDDFISPKPMLA